MDIKQESYISSNSYFSKLTITPSPIEFMYFSKYYEPTFEAGGTITDGTTSFVLQNVTKKVYTDSPIAQQFDPTAMSISLAQAGVYANVYRDVVSARIQSVMNTLRAIDSTSVETVKYKVV